MFMWSLLGLLRRLRVHRLHLHDVQSRNVLV